MEETSNLERTTKSTNNSMDDLNSELADILSNSSSRRAPRERRQLTEATDGRERERVRTRSEGRTVMAK